MLCNKFTDDEIIKALREAAKKYEGKTVATCETNISNMATDAADHIERLRNEINRQNAWIEKAGVACEECRKLSKREHNEQVELLKDLEQKIPIALRQVKEVSIREFAERLKLYLFIERGGFSTVSGKDIDYIAQKMTEGQP